jgi:hemolysin III
MRQLDHAAVYLLIAGSYTPFGLLALSGAWRWVTRALRGSAAAACKYTAVALFVAG